MVSEDCASRAAVVGATSGEVEKFSEFIARPPHSPPPEAAALSPLCLPANRDTSAEV
jgi:hypothetical protein